MVVPAGSSRARRRPNKADARPIVFDERTMDKVRWCRRRLLAWYDQHGRQFPWRSPAAGLFEQVVAEVLLQRTQASTVGRFFESFFILFKSWDDIHAASTEFLESTLRPIGLWRRRAIALKELAREMVGRAAGFPASRDELEALPAVGQYVASAVLLFAHKRPEPLLDGNMARVLERVFEPRHLVDIRYDPRLQGLARLLVRSRNSIRVNWAILDLAASHCGPRSPACDRCPLQIRCNHAVGATFARELASGGRSGDHDT
jgi:A/G-specific adenine glycosylase